MQALNIRKRNCRRFADQAQPLMNNTQQLQRIRCCGRVLTEQEVSNGLLLNTQSRGQEMTNGRGIENGQGRSKVNTQCQGQGRGRANGQGQGQGRSEANGQGCGRANDQGQGQGRRMANG